MVTRKLLFPERIMYGDGHSPFNGVFAVKIKGALVAGNLCRALEKVQDKYPLLRARVVQDKKGIPHFIVSEEKRIIPLRMVGRYADEDWIRESKLEWATPFDMVNGPLLRVVWLKSEAVSDLLLAFHHCMCDGGSALALMRDLLTVLDQPAREIGTYTGFTPLEELLPGTVFTMKARAKARLMSILMQTALFPASVLVATNDRRSLSRQRDYLLHWKLDKETSASVFNYCREAHVTVNTALCVAFLSAFQCVKGDKAFNKIMCPIDIRRYNPAIKKDDLFAFGLAIILSMKDKDRETGFWKKVIKMQEVISGKTSKLNAGEFLLMLEYSHASVRTMIKFLTFGKPGNDLMFSNMGRLDIGKEYDSFEVETLYSPTIIGPFGNPTTVVTTTFNDQMDFCFVSNDDFLPNTEASAIKEKAMELLTGAI
jgi:NRPS condensation-like uncharacterized protein